MRSLPDLPYAKAAYAHRKLIAIVVLILALVVVSILLHQCKKAEVDRETVTAMEGERGTFRVTDPLTSTDIKQTTQSGFVAAHVYRTHATVDGDTVRCRRLCDDAGIGSKNRNYIVQTTHYTNTPTPKHECLCLRGQPDDGFLSEAAAILRQVPGNRVDVERIAIRTDAA